MKTLCKSEDPAHKVLDSLDANPADSEEKTRPSQSPAASLEEEAARCADHRGHPGPLL